MVGNRIRPLKKLKNEFFCILHSSEGRLRRQKWGEEGGTVTISKSAGGLSRVKIPLRVTL